MIITGSKYNNTFCTFKNKIAVVSLKLMKKIYKTNKKTSILDPAVVVKCKQQLKKKAFDVTQTTVCNVHLTPREKKVSLAVKCEVVNTGL